MINLKEIQPGDTFSESSVYIFQNQEGSNYKMKHLGSGEIVSLSGKYVENLLKTGDQYQKEVKVGKEDKYWTAAQITASMGAIDPDIRVGDVKLQGIRSIWNSIPGHVFTVCFEKQGKTLSDKAYNTKVAQTVTKALADIDAAKVAKKGVAKTASQVIEEIIKNPVLRYEAGEMRVMKAVKTQWESSTGFFDVIDLEKNEKRQVNLNSIAWLVYDGVKYIVEQ